MEHRGQMEQSSSPPHVNDLRNETIDAQHHPYPDLSGVQTPSFDLLAADHCWSHETDH